MNCRERGFGYLQAHAGFGRTQSDCTTLQINTARDQLTLRDRYRAEVAREGAAANAARGLPDKRRVIVRFGP